MMGEVDQQWDRRATCLSRARAYGSAVSNLGKQAYDAAQKLACECCRRVTVRVQMTARSQLIAPFVTAQVSDEGFTLELPLPIQDGTFAVTNFPGGTASRLMDSRAGCLQPSLGGAWDELEAGSATVTGALLTIEGVRKIPLVTRGVGEGDCAVTTTTESPRTETSGLQILLPSEVLSGTLNSQLLTNESGWTWNWSP